jgi:hypothetical protein
MSEKKYNILTTSLRDYQAYYWERTRDARVKLRMDDIEWKLICNRNYYQEKCEALEKKLNEIHVKNKD